MLMTFSVEIMLYILYFVMCFTGVNNYSFVFSPAKGGVLKQGILSRFPWASEVFV